LSTPHRSFDTARVILLSIGHGIHDMYPAFLAPLLPLIQAKMGLSNTLAGSLATFLRSSSVAQPFIGYLADRTSARLFVILAPGATAIFMSLIGAAPSYGYAALLLLLVGMSHASYHAPAPAMVARVSGERVGGGMSFFMTGGELVIEGDAGDWLGAHMAGGTIVVEGGAGHFVECIRKNLPEPVPAEQALITQRILDGVYESSKTGKEVKV